MIGIFLTVAEKVLILFVMIGVGVVLCKRRMLSKRGADQINAILVNLVSPCVVISGFQIGRENVSLESLGLTALMAISSFFVAILLTRFFFNRQPEGARRVLKFASIYSNCAFMGFPLVEAILGKEGILYASIFLAVFNLFCWTHGYTLMNNAQERQKLSKTLLNPGTIGVLIGLPLFLLSIKLPEALSVTLDSFAALNTPLAMMCIGVYIAQLKFQEALRDRQLYWVCFLRLLLIPLAVFLVMLLFHPEKTPFVSCMIQVCAPVAGMTAIFASKLGQDTSLAAKTVAVSTLFSIFTMPIFATLAQIAAG